MNDTKYIAILGAGESGTGSALLAKKLGWKIFLSDKGEIKLVHRNKLDQAGIEYESGKHTTEKILNADLIIKSPGIPPSSPLIREASEKGIEIISEIEFGFRYCKGKIIAVTGSNGKTTTSHLIQHILTKAGKKSALVGNVGKSFAGSVAEEDHDYYVIEVSSFQLDDIISFKPDISVLLNITPDHLDRYEYNLQNYIDSKFRIIKNADDGSYFIYNLDDEVITKELENRKTKARLMPFTIKSTVAEGACLKDDQLYINFNKNQFKMSVHELALQGKHNIYNSMAASIAGRILELRKDVIRESLSDFQNIEHRLEFVMNVHGISFINDSKATNVNSSWYALESIENNIVWIVGGVDKGNDYSQMKELVIEKVKAIVCLGKDNKKIIDAFGSIVPKISEAGSALEAVKQAYEFGSKGDTVLLSPACASFDLFDNYEDRGHQFKKAVRSL